MADPITVVQVISAATSLASQCAQVIKGLHDLAGKIKTAELSIRSTTSELDIIRLAWERIEGILRSWEVVQESDEDLIQRLRQNLDFGTMVVSSLADVLDTFGTRPFTIRQRSRYVWNEERFKGHQDRVRGHVSAMNLLISVLLLYVDIPISPCPSLCNVIYALPFPSLCNLRSLDPLISLANNMKTIRSGPKKCASEWRRTITQIR